MSNLTVPFRNGDIGYAFQFQPEFHLSCCMQAKVVLCNLEDQAMTADSKLEVLGQWS